MTRVLALADQSKIGCITQRRFAKVGTKTHPQRGADLDRNGLSVSTETACRFEPKSPIGNSEICTRARSPGSRARSVHTCWGLRPRRAVRALALARPSVLPSTQCTVSASRGCCFRGSIPSLCAPLSTLHQNPHGFQRMTRGQCGSLDLHWQRLALFTPCRSPGARIVNLGGRGMLLMSVARQLGLGNSSARLLCCPAQA